MGTLFALPHVRLQAILGPIGRLVMESEGLSAAEVRYLVKEFHARRTGSQPGAADSPGRHRDRTACADA
jgi:hypothetical protein